MEWLEQRHSIDYSPEFADDPVSLRQAAYRTAGIVFPRQFVITPELLDALPQLRVIGRLHVGSDNTDLEVCRDRDIKVIHASSANVRSNAEYLLSCLLLMYRRGVLAALMGRRHPSSQMGRELSGSTVGLLGLAPTAHLLAGMLGALGARLIGYDPAVHHAAPIWERLRIRPVSLPELMGSADAVSLQMLYATRFRGFVNDKLLAMCKPQQLWVSIGRSELFDEEALASALRDGRIEACIVDAAEPGFLAERSPLHGLKNLMVTPRLGSHTREARLRSSWYVAHRMHEALGGTGHPPGQTHSVPMELDGTAHTAGLGSPSQWGDPETMFR